MKVVSEGGENLTIKVTKGNSETVEVIDESGEVLHEVHISEGIIKLGPFAPRDVVNISIKESQDSEISPNEPRTEKHPSKKVEVKLCKDSNSVDQNGKCIDTCHQSWCKGSCTANCNVSYIRIKLYTKIKKSRDLTAVLYVPTSFYVKY